MTILAVLCYLPTTINKFHLLSFKLLNIPRDRKPHKANVLYLTMRPNFINFQPWKAEFLNLLGKNHLNKFNLCYWKPKCLNHQHGNIAKPILKILCLREISHNQILMAGASLKTKPKWILNRSSKTNDFPLGRLELTNPVKHLGGLHWASWWSIRQYPLLLCGQSGSIILPLKASFA